MSHIAEEKQVSLRLPKTRTEQDDVFVSVNSRTWLIKRGQTVRVPECVAKLLQNRELALEAALAYEKQQSK